MQLNYSIDKIRNYTTDISNIFSNIMKQRSHEQLLCVLATLLIIFMYLGMEHNFYKEDNMTVSNFGVEYDYNSVMHYSSTAFSKNGRRTIIPLEVDLFIILYS